MFTPPAWRQKEWIKLWESEGKNEAISLSLHTGKMSSKANQPSLALNPGRDGVGLGRAFYRQLVPMIHVLRSRLQIFILHIQVSLLWSELKVASGAQQHSRLQEGIYTISFCGPPSID